MKPIGIPCKPDLLTFSAHKTDIEIKITSSSVLSDSVDIIKFVLEKIAILEICRYFHNFTNLSPIFRNSITRNKNESIDLLSAYETIIGKKSRSM